MTQHQLTASIESLPSSVLGTHEDLELVAEGAIKAVLAKRGISVKFVRPQLGGVSEIVVSLALAMLRSIWSKIQRARKIRRSSEAAEDAGWSLTYRLTVPEIASTAAQRAALITHLLDLTEAIKSELHSDFGEHLAVTSRVILEGTGHEITVLPTALSGMGYDRLAAIASKAARHHTSTVVPRTLWTGSAVKASKTLPPIMTISGTGNTASDTPD
ncbi:hypothetical protein Leucomu_11160 [Leucobacter muris]|uniref:Uncharacterized protein n=1 Tax=Leucobacter muris TaxID=1935379 RepID=A0ABX5QHH2_9MICO|nr:hypothetical protein [Leucobacter muris]QAB18399.1 hypothetical protein Leucomu_11160 [Leucobacter muris]